MVSTFPSPVEASTSRVISDLRASSPRTRSRHRSELGEAAPNASLDRSWEMAESSAFLFVADILLSSFLLLVLVVLLYATANGEVGGGDAAHISISGSFFSR